MKSQNSLTSLMNAHKLEIEEMVEEHRKIVDERNEVESKLDSTKKDVIRLQDYVDELELRLDNASNDKQAGESGLALRLRALEEEKNILAKQVLSLECSIKDAKELMLELDGIDTSQIEDEKEDGTLQFFMKSLVKRVRVKVLAFDPSYFNSSSLHFFFLVVFDRI